jgi:hypothetical protein
VKCKLVVLSIKPDCFLLFEDDCSVMTENTLIVGWCPVNKTRTDDVDGAHLSPADDQYCKNKIKTIAEGIKDVGRLAILELSKNKSF